MAFKKKIISFIFFTLLIFHLKNENKTFLIFGGKTGWIGQKIVKLISEQKHIIIIADSRLENRQDIINEIEKTKPDFIINAAGINGRPNVDWCEDNKQKTIRVNIIGTLNLIDLSYLYNIHLTNISTGCIYQYDSKHSIENNIGFTERDEPNFNGSFYSRSKTISEKLILEYPNVLNLRFRMPISHENHERNFITKITNYKKIINIPNSVTVLEDLLPIAIDMTLKEIKGNYNFVNPGIISHNEILDLYKECINPNFTYENFTIEEQSKILKAGRSNCHLDVAKLLLFYPNIPDIKFSIKKVFERMKKNNN